MGMAARNHLNEAEKLVELIDERKINTGTKRGREDYLFYLSMKERLKVGGFVTEKQIFWLRDIKDRQINT